MLNLKSKTSGTWLDSVQAHLDDILIDHAHCEKKAAGVAMNLIFAYVDRTDFVRALAEIVDEELAHFRMVLDLLDERGIAFRRLRPSNYGRRLHELVRRDEPGRAVDRCLVAALIEARSCERFVLLRDSLADAALAEFYGSLYESEARHHATYVRFAGLFASDEEVSSRLDELAAHEAEILRENTGPARVHSA